MYEEEILKISEIMKERLTEKYATHKDLCKTIDYFSLTHRVQFLYKKLEEDFPFFSFFAKLSNNQPVDQNTLRLLQKRLLDLAIQSMLLHLRLEEVKKF